jgi:MoxR-like ATPase
MFNLWLDYPSYDEEVQVIKSTTSDYTPTLEKVVTTEELISFQNLVRRVPIADNVIEYAVKVVKASRTSVNSVNSGVKDLIAWGAGPRASQYLILAAKTKAVINGGFTPQIADINDALLPVLRHRIIPTFNAEADGITSVDIIKKILEEVN